MAITISNTDDFIRALRENEDFQAAARRELLTQDLLELPGEFREYRTMAEARFDSVQEGVEVVQAGRQRARRIVQARGPGAV